MSFISLLEFFFSDTALYLAVTVIAIFFLQRYFASKTAVTAQIPRLMARTPPEKRDYTREELKQFDGSDPTKAILLGVKGKIYDVSPAAGFYGLGGAYHAFAGKDASRALAKGDTDPEVAANPDISDLSPAEQNTLDEWFQMYSRKYDFVGNVKD